MKQRERSPGRVSGTGLIKLYNKGGGIVEDTAGKPDLVAEKPPGGKGGTPVWSGKSSSLCWSEICV